MQTEDTFAQRRAELSVVKQVLLEKRLRQSMARTVEEDIPLVRSHSENAPLSFAQQRLWFLQQLEPESSAYNEPVILRLSGPFDLEAFIKAGEEVIRRHEILRTTFPIIDGQPVQKIEAPELAGLNITHLDLRGIPAAEREAEVRRRVKEEIRKPFHLLEEIPWRVVLLRLDQEEHVSMTIIHHILTDGWSMALFSQETVQLYSAFANHQPSPLPEPTLQYGDYVQWQNQWARSEAYTAQLAYWKRQLAGELPVLDLPADRPRPSIATYRGQHLPLVIPAELTQRLRECCQHENVTLFMALLTAFKVLLARYTRLEEIIVGTPVANRNRLEFEKLIGCFVNTLVLRTSLEGNPSFHEALQRVREVALAAYDHQDVAFEQLVEELQPTRDLSHSALFQIMFTLQNVPLAEGQETNKTDLTVIPLEIDNGTAKFDLEISLREYDQQISGFLEYNTDLFEQATIERLSAHLQLIIETMLTRPEQGIYDFTLITGAEQEELAIWNDTFADNPSDTGFAALFTEQVERSPLSSALAFEQENWTYQDLNERANRLARYLSTQGIEQGTLVGVFMDRSPDLLVSLLSLLKLGGVYLPLDPTYPAERLRVLLQNSSAAFLLTQDKLRANLPENSAKIIAIDTISSAPEQKSEQDYPTAVDAKSLAYVIYTSGSTGQPKGAMLEQGGMLNHLHAKIADLGIHAQDRLVQTANQCFDISVWQFLAPLLVGAQVHIVPDNIAHQPTHLLDLLAREHITLWECVPSLLRLVLEHLEATSPATRPTLVLRWLIVTGEALPRELCDRWLALYPAIPLLNAYGPTECSDDVTHYPVRRPQQDDGAQVPIGRAVANTQLYVLDAHGQPVPINVPGELYVGGRGVGRGYLGDPARTAEVFLRDPFSNQPGARLYKTGDLVRYRPGGVLEFLGRTDQQVKLRGYRVELGEIEEVLKKHPTVRDCVVIARKDTPGSQHLVAYVVPAQALAGNELQLFVRDLLPEYMVPSAIVVMETLPLTANGKINRKALPAPGEHDMLRENASIEPRTPLEKELAAIWSEILDVQHVGLHDDFFELGGHSLLIIRLVTRIEQQFGQRLPLATIFNHRTIEAQALLLQHYAAPSFWSPGAELRLPEIDLQREVVLDLQIAPEVWPGELNIQPATILLTGATGFLGTFLLADLLTQTSAHIYCLVRASTEEESLNRIQHSLDDALLWREEFRPRIIPLIGDLSKTYLGLSQARFEELCQEIETIYHNGAMVNMIYPYSALKSTNVDGTREILRLATHGCVKPLHYISTLSVFSHYQVDQEQVIREQEPLEEHREHLLGGYAQSKWVAEKLVLIARSRGLPVAIYRPGRITGHSQTGAWRAEDVLSRLIRGCIQAGSVPDAIVKDTIELTSVDYVSQAIVALSRRRSSLGQAFHLCNQARTRVSDMMNWISASGYPVQVMPYQQWRAMLTSASAEQASNALVEIAAMLPGEVIDEPKGAEAPQCIFDDRNTRGGLRQTAIVCPQIDSKVMEAYLSFMRLRGLLPKTQYSRHLETANTEIGGN